MIRYLRGYYNLIKYAQNQNRSKETDYYERHHIIPRSFGGTNKPDNLVLLTAKEHYIAHYLLTKFTEGNMKRKAVYAFHSFKMDRDGDRKINTPRLFEKSRREMSKIMSGKNNPMYGKTHTPESRKKISENRKGKAVGPKNPWHRSNRTEEELKQRGEKATLSTKKNWEKLSDEEKEKIRIQRSQTMKRYWANVSDEEIKQHIEKSNKWKENRTPQELEEINKKKINTGLKNGRTLIYEIIYNDKTYQISTIENLENFCKEYKLVFNLLYKYVKKCPINSDKFSIIPKPSKHDTKYLKDSKYKENRDRTTGIKIRRYKPHKGQ